MNSVIYFKFSLNVNKTLIQIYQKLSKKLQFSDYIYRIFKLLGISRVMLGQWFSTWGLQVLVLKSLKIKIKINFPYSSILF